MGIFNTLFERKQKSEQFKGEATRSSIVDAMLVQCVHEPDQWVKPAAGDALKKLAKDALGKMDSNLKLKNDAYVRFTLIDGGFPHDNTGTMSNMFAQSADMMNQMGMSSDMKKKLYYLSGGKSLSKMEEEAKSNLSQEMKKMMLERKLVPDAYELRTFKESPDPGVTFLWIAAIRK